MVGIYYWFTGMLLLHLLLPGWNVNGMLFPALRKVSIVILAACLTGILLLLTKCGVKRISPRVEHQGFSVIPMQYATATESGQYGLR